MSSEPPATASTVPTLRFGATILLGAFLLFQVQPQIARIILPWFGGGAAVWSACMLFFQVQLLAGYAYAHLLHRRFAPRAQAAVHVTLLAASLLFLPVIPGEHWKPTGDEAPTLHILLLLLATVGVPYLLLAATGPLLQSWFARGAVGRSPYRLYALSNLGSLAALLSFPFVFEPNLTIGVQAQVWALAYVVFFALCTACAWSASRQPPPAVVGLGVGAARASAGAARATADPPAAPAASQVIGWMVLAALPSVMLLAVTNAICVDVAVIPFFWVMPLAIYLLTFILTFESDRWYRPVSMGLVLAVSALFLVLVGDDSWYTESISIQALTLSGCLFLCGMVCHGELVRHKPPPLHLTGFYLSVALGGATGGVFVAVLAPRLFDTYLEVEVGLAGCLIVGAFACASAFTRAVGRGFVRMLMGRAVPAMLVLGLGVVVVLRVLDESESEYLERSRSFFGRITVEREWNIEEPGESGRTSVRQTISLRHGSTLHGEQVTGVDVEPGEGFTYYCKNSGVGYALLNHPAAPQRGLRIGVIGLGTGTLAHYARPEDHLTYFEIDPEIVRVAGEFFTYLSDARRRGATVELCIGDARVQLERRRRGKGEPGFDVLVVDAFSSDAIPVHLLTLEANRVYWRHLAPDGILLVHVSNRVLDLRPVVVGMAADVGRELRLVDLDADDTNADTSSVWALVTANLEFLALPKMQEPASQPELEQPALHWTDDFSSLWHIIR